MPLDGKRAVSVSEDLDLARRAGLDPERRALVTRVPQHRSEHELRHVAVASTWVVSGQQCTTRASVSYPSLPESGLRGSVKRTASTRLVGRSDSSIARFGDRESRKRHES